MYVNVRTVGITNLRILNASKIDEYREEFLNFGRRMRLWQNALILRSLNYPLDYVVGCPSKSKSESKLKHNKNMLKNIMFDKVM